MIDKAEWTSLVKDAKDYNNAFSFFEGRLNTTTIFETAICSYEYLSQDSKSKGKIVIDLGCGSGWFSSYLTSKDDIKKVYSVDQDLSGFRNCILGFEKIFHGNSKKIIPVESDFERLEIKENLVDEVFFVASFHHSDDIQKLIEKVKKILKPGGSIYLLNEDLHTFNTLLILRLKMALSQVKSFLFSRKLKKYKYEKYRVLYDPELNDWAIDSMYIYDFLANNGFLQIWKIFEHSTYIKQNKFFNQPNLFAVRAIKN